MRTHRDTERTAVILTPDTDKDREILDAIRTGKLAVTGCGRMSEGTILHLTIGIIEEHEVGRRSCSEADEMRPGGDRSYSTLAQRDANVAGHPALLRTDVRHYGSEK